MTLLAGRYELREVVARDRTGAYHAARDVRLGRDVTVKRLSTKTANADAFVREARVLGGSTEPGLVQVFEVDVRPPDPYMVIEPLEGEDLASVLARGPVAFNDALTWITTIAGALRAAHRLGFVHASVSPRTIFIGRDGAKLLGFGGALLVGSQVEHAPKEAYVAPELIAGEGRADPRSDVYSLAVVAFELLTGKLPRDRSDAVLRRATSLGKDLPAEVDILFASALDTDPTARAQSIGQFSSAWRALGRPRKISTKAPVIAVGTRIGRAYEVTGVLGSGTFGTVLLALDDDLKRHVALKLLHELGGAAREKFFAEARAMAAIDHPNVVRVYALGNFDDVPYLVMEHVSGPTVEQLVADEGLLAIPDATSILQQTARGLDAVHAAGLTHADVKPANVLVGPAFRACVTDFGLATMASNWTSDMAAGSPAYMAPERVRGTVETALAHRVDVYSLGVMAYELLTGRLPFVEATPAAVMRAHVEREPRRPSEVRKDLPLVFDEVVLRALAKNPSERTPSCDAFRAALDEATRRVTRPRAAHRVLVVDDDPHFRELVAILLERDFEGVRIDAVENAAQALRALDQQTYDVALLDLDLPDANAVELSATIRADFESPPPLVVITGTGSAADWQVLSSLGVRAFLLKPLNRDALSVTLRRFMEPA